MWLLHTRTLKLHYFLSPETVEEGYLILSHCWGHEEQSFQDVQKIHERCDTTGEDPHGLVSTKIRKTCALAKHHGYKWAWIDTCCIDKTSSAELMEAINAMYRFYALSLVCYVYFPDVPDHYPDRIKSGLFDDCADSHPMITSHWRFRGWTLQELIAPRIVHFLSREWSYIGTKDDLADGLEPGLGIPATILRHEQSPLEFSVAERMSWASNRSTTRVEDEAYSLLGLFGINMPTLYGEGRKAFQRLQEEILKQTGDTTLFAWGASESFSSLRDYLDDAQTGLLATAPSDFGPSRGINVTAPTPTPGSRNSCNRSIRIRSTPHGYILARIPVLYINGQAFGELSWQQDNARLFLVLKLRTRRSHLPYPTYDIGLRSANAVQDAHPLRLVRVQDSDLHHHRPMSWLNILLLKHRPPTQRRVAVHIPMNHSFSPSIRIPEHVIESLFIQAAAAEVSIANAQLPWSGNLPLMISYRDDGVFDVLYALVQFGRCTSHTTNGKESGSFWANFRGSPDRREPSKAPSHECPADHILAWPGLERRFVLEFYPVDEVSDEPPAINTPIAGRMAKWLLRMTFKISETTGVLVLTSIWRGYRSLLKSANYRDPIEGREERARHMIQVTTIDTEHPRSPSLERDLSREVAPSSDPNTGLATQQHQCSVEVSLKYFDIHTIRLFPLQALFCDSWASCLPYLSTFHLMHDDSDIELFMY